jgi:hypothetical protein
MEKGDISTTTLVAIILGVILAVVFVYLVYFYPKQSKLNCSLCKAEFTYWCSECNTTTPNPWDDVPMSDNLIKCIQENCIEGVTDTTDSCNPKKNYCKSYIPGLVIS